MDVLTGAMFSTRVHIQTQLAHRDNSGRAASPSLIHLFKLLARYFFHQIGQRIKERALAKPGKPRLDKLIEWFFQVET